jgi:TolA-binding protein
MPIHALAVSLSFVQVVAICLATVLALVLAMAALGHGLDTLRRVNEQHRKVNDLDAALRARIAEIRQNNEQIAELCSRIAERHKEQLEQKAP